MLVQAVKMVAVTASVLVLSQGWRADVGKIEPQEIDAPLFDNDMFTNRHAVVGKQGKSLDIDSTLNSWAEGSASSEASEPEGEAPLRNWMLTFQTTPVFSADAPDSSGNGGSGTKCSIGQGVETCSVANAEDGPNGGGGSNCSTKDGGPGAGNGTETCSVYVEDASNTDNIGCSAYGSGGGGNVGCSAGGDTESEACSTSGGDSGSGEADGAAVCSAALTDGNECSAFGGTEATCSTHGGEHQSCSAGATGTGETTSCSTDGAGSGDASGENSFCSVGDQSSGDRPNSCSATSHGAPSDDGSADCSTLDSGGGKCSVMEDSAGNTNGGVCTAIGQDGAAPPATYQCSTKPNHSGGPDTTGSDLTCSVIDEDGNVEGPGTSNPARCGDGNLAPTPPTPPTPPPSGGAVDPITGLLSLVLLGAAGFSRRRRQRFVA